MKPSWFGTALAIAAANALFYVWGRHTFMPLGVVWVSAVLLGVLLLVLAAILQAFNKARPDPAARLSIRMSVLSAIVCFATLPTVPVLEARHRADFEDARARAERLIDALAAHAERHGTYPASLEELQDPEPLPWLLRLPDAYRATGTGYVLQIRRPGHPFLALERRHNETRWRTTR
ncbi:MAG: hypothetical protein NZ740_02995 [Kiritimatiellae bacterium]|nr:hypothetical protein [Kiritimatiellia bacterium]MDW8458059.1 hypothetical protein [Verrucomicrobiota bacterium]